MIIEDQPDRGRRRIGRIEKCQEFDELARAVAILDEGMDMAGQEIDSGKQAQRAVAPLFVIAREGRMSAGFGRQVRRRLPDCLQARLLVVGDDSHCLARLRRRGPRFLQDLDLFVNAQDFRHFLFELGIVALEIIADLVRLHLSRVEDLADGALGQIGKAGMVGQKPRRLKLVRIAEVLGFLAGKNDQPFLGLGGNGVLLAGAWTVVVERRQRAKGNRPLDATLDGLMMYAERAPHREERWFVSIGQQHLRPLDPARRLGSRSPRASTRLRLQWSTRPQAAVLPLCKVSFRESRNQATPRRRSRESYPNDAFGGIGILAARFGQFDGYKNSPWDEITCPITRFGLRCQRNALLALF